MNSKASLKATSITCDTCVSREGSSIHYVHTAATLSQLAKLLLKVSSSSSNQQIKFTLRQ
eukprot:5871-Heterococcus_DN1.PRE.3